MKFRISERLPPHLDRRLQLRMLGYVGMIAVLMVVWQAWQAATKPPPKEGGSAADLRQIDFDVENDAEAAPLEDDEIRIVPRRSRRQAARSEAEREVSEVAAKENHIDIPADWLEGVEDNTVGIRQHEADAFYQVLDQAQTTPLKEVKAHALTEALFVNLMTSPEKYRGKPVTIVGEMRKLRSIPSSKKQPRSPQLYEAWICTAESGDHPYRVVCTEIPKGITPRENCRVDVKTTGYFFKREGYETQDHRLQVTPTVLAGRLELSVSPNAPPPVEHLVPWMVGVLSVIGLAMLATVIGYAVGDARVRRHRRSDALNRLELDAMSRASDARISIEESLRRLEDEPLFEESDSAVAQRNGHATSEDTVDDEQIDLPTPFPPTRVPKRWD